MQKKTPLIVSGAVIAGALLALGGPLAASAHVGVTPSDTAAGSYSLLTFSVPHGCDGSGTTAVSIQIPEEINGVTPTVNPNWTVTKDMVDLSDPITDAHGNSLVQRVGSVTYTAKEPLADGFRDAFELSLQLPDSAGKTLVFPTLQTCETGSTDWSEIAAEGQDEHDLAAPAPSVTITAASEAHGEHTATPEAAPAAAEQDVLARVFGLGGIAVGVVGVIVGTLGLRARREAKA
ncbi:YcnI family copper-binding membrane protein [Mycetocola spongiae]|uniref:YcnI family copper-binding membrane protein n=1 Tax=Mycetocola spongiae TaxID=2859226 RepID=UPI001CF3E4A1|nr:YcnI family protein [Mycetocola spongiae]UCR88479.1 YcnI family protein [Mycetocola spongiae]